jgi:hypothetical protein
MKMSPAVFAALAAASMVFLVEKSGAQAPTGIEVQDYRGIPYVSGGVGEDSRDALKEAVRDYNLKLIFANKSGHYLAAINVLITRPNGDTVLDAVSKGPWFYAKLPPGSYTVIAKGENSSRERKVKVGAGLTTVEIPMDEPGSGPLSSPLSWGWDYACVEDAAFYAPALASLLLRME